MADQFQGWIDDNGLEEINPFESSDPQSITWAVEGEHGGFNITVASVDDTVQATVMTGES